MPSVLPRRYLPRGDFLDCIVTESMKRQKWFASPLCNLESLTPSIVLEVLILFFADKDFPRDTHAFTNPNQH
jgi:hypothetical protein